MCLPSRTKDVLLLVRVKTVLPATRSTSFLGSCLKSGVRNICVAVIACAVNTQKTGSLGKGVSVRAVEKVSDFLLLETDPEEGGEGRLGWVDASCVVPQAFPALYEFASDLPDAVRLCSCSCSYDVPGTLFCARSCSYLFVSCLFLFLLCALWFFLLCAKDGCP